MISNYRKATSWVCDIIENLIVDGKLDFDDATFASTLTSWTFGIHLHTNDESCWYTVDQHLGSNFVDLSNTDYNFFDLCVEVCSTNIKFGHPIPRPLRGFCSDVLTGKLTRPTPAYRERKRNFLEQLMIWTLVHDVSSKFDLLKTRNDASAKISACDAVAEAFSVCGRPTRYTEIRDLINHPDKARLRKEFRASAQIYARFLEGSPTNALSPDYDVQMSKQAAETVRDIIGTFPPTK